MAVVFDFDQTLAPGTVQALLARLGVDDAERWDRDCLQSYVADHSPAGSRVELRADLNTLVVLSNTPHPLDPSPSYSSKPVALVVRGGEPAAADDPCRTARPETERGFILTDRYFE